MSNSDQLCLLGTPQPPPVSPVSAMTGQAAAALGWDGAIAEDMSLFGQRVAVVAEVDWRAHRQRVLSGQGPVTDRMSVALWEWPEYQATMPPSAVALLGVVSRGTRWQRALATAGGFVGFCSTAIVVEQNHDLNRHCLVTAHLYGVSVLRTAPNEDLPKLVQVGRNGPVATARPSLLSRWVEELVYARFLDEGVITTSSAG